MLSIKVKQTKDFRLNSMISFSSEEEKKDLVKKALKEDNYETVAMPISVGSIDNILNEVYRMTNSIDRPWWENDNVYPVFEREGCRSTSVGDVIEIEEQKYLVDSFGFTIID